MTGSALSPRYSRYVVPSLADATHDTIPSAKPGALGVTRRPGVSGWAPAHLRRPPHTRANRTSAFHGKSRHVIDCDATSPSPLPIFTIAAAWRHVITIDQADTLPELALARHPRL